jgi:cation diffusion facilitator family transporter
MKTDIRNKRLFRVVMLGMLVNSMLAVLKIGSGYWGRSQAVLADGIHTLSDIISDIGLLVGIHYWSEPADDSHPYGHGRVETLVALGISLLLAGVAVGIGVSAVQRWQDCSKVVPGRMAMIAAGVSLVVKEVLYRWTLHHGRREKSAAVIANAWHHRSDALSSVPAFIAVLVSRIWPELSFVDGVGALLVSLLILGMAWTLGREAMANLIDRGAPKKIREKISGLLESLDDVQEVHKIRTRSLGSGWSVDLHLLVDGDMSVRQSHRIADIAKAKLLEEGPDVIDVVVHVEPYEE